MHINALPIYSPVSPIPIRIIPEKKQTAAIKDGQPRDIFIFIIFFMIKTNAHRKPPAEAILPIKRKIRKGATEKLMQLLHSFISDLSV